MLNRRRLSQLAVDRPLPLDDHDAPAAQALQQRRARRRHARPTLRVKAVQRPALQLSPHRPLHRASTISAQTTMHSNPAIRSGSFRNIGATASGPLMWWNRRSACD